MTVSATVRQSSGLVPLLGRILGSGLLAAAVALVSWFVLARTSLPAFSNSNATKALASAGTALVFLVLAIVVYFMLHPKAPREGSRPAAARVWHVLGVLICWLAPAALVVAVLGIPLAATRLYLDGISVDQAFRTQFLTKMATDPGYSDMAYLDMPSFYPRLWFITGGLFAQLVGLAGWAAFQPWALVTLAATASVLVPVWQRITGSLPLGSVIATVTTVVVLYIAPEEPYAAIVALGMPAAAVLAGRAVRGSWPAMTGLVIYLGLSANLYTLHTAIAALSAVLIALVVAWKGRGTRVEGIAGGAAYRPWQPVARLAIIGIGSIAIALVGWAPYLFRLFSSEHGSTGRAQHYLPESGTEIPTPFFDFSIVGVLALVCVVWIALKSRERIAQYLLAGLVVSYGWILLSMIAPVAGTTLLGFRVELPVTLYLVTGGVLALAHVRRTGFATVYPAFVTTALAPKITLLLGAVLAFATASYAVSVPLHLQNEIDLAYTDTDGDASRGDTLPADSTVYFADVDAAIRQLRGDDNRQNTVVLTDEQGFMAYNSYPVFQAISAHYANPLGQYEKRNAEIEHWTTIEDPDELRAAMDASAQDNGWRTPDVFLLRGQLDDKGTGDIDSFSYRISEDIYPNDPNVRFRPVSFHAAAFSSGWVLRQIGPFVLAVRE